MTLLGKRLNPKTGVPFARWDTRDEDDLVFSNYVHGKYAAKESWMTREKLSIKVKLESERRKSYEQRNPGKHRARNSKNNAQRLKRKPKWIKDVFEKEIKEMYQMAAELEKIFPWKMHLDHVIPKQGKDVSGLHVPWNLEILPWIENIKKGNKFDVNAEQPPSLPEGTYKNGKVYTQFGIVPAPRTWEDRNYPDDYRRATEGENPYRSAKEGS